MCKIIIELKTSLTIERALDILKKHSVDNYFQLKNESLVGTVSKKKISLYRGVPFQSNSFLPVFKGKFEKADGMVILKGKWTLHWFAKISIGIFLLIPFIQIIREGFSWNNIALLVFVWLIVFVIYKIGTKFGEKDKSWILYKLKDILALAKT